MIFVDPTRLRLRAGWRIAIGFAAMITAIGILAAVVDTIEIPFVESFLWQVLAAPVLIGLAMLLTRIDRHPFDVYGLAWQPGRLALGALFGAALVTLLWLVQLGLGWVEIGDTLRNRYAVPFLAGWIGFALRYAAVAIFEELFHRGFLITNLAEGFGGPRPRRGLACWVAAVLFGALHLTNDGATPLAALNVALLGLLFGLAYVRTGTLSLSIGLHFAWNFLLGPAFGLPVSGYAPRVSLVFSEITGPALWTGGDFGPEGGLLTTLVLVTALAIVGALGRIPRVSAPARHDGTVVDG